MACILWTVKPPSSSRKMGHSTESPEEPFTSMKSSSAGGPESMSSPYGSSSSFATTAFNFFCVSSNAFRAIPSRHEATSSSKIAPGAGPHSNFSFPSNANHVFVLIMPLTSNPGPFAPWKNSTASSVFFPKYISSVSSSPHQNPLSINAACAKVIKYTSLSPFLSKGHS